MIKLKMKIYKTMLAGKQQDHQHCHQGKLINMNILQAKKNLRLCCLIKE